MATRERGAYRKREEIEGQEETRRENYVFEQPPVASLSLPKPPFSVVSYGTDCGLRAPRASIQTKINVDERAIFHFDSGPDGSREPPAVSNVLSLSRSHPPNNFGAARLVLAKPYNYGKTETRINPETDWSEYIYAHQRVPPYYHMTEFSLRTEAASHIRLLRTKFVSHLPRTRFTYLSTLFLRRVLLYLSRPLYPIHPSIHLAIHLSVRPSARPSVCRFVQPSAC